MMNPATGTFAAQEILVPEEGAESVSTRPASPTMLAVRRFLRHRIAVASLLVLVLMALAAVCAPLITSHDPFAQDLLTPGLQPPNSTNLLGTDDLGRDVLSRLVYAGRYSLTIGFASTLLTLAIGIVVGAVAGYVGGWLDNVLMRFVDLVLAFPSLFLLLIVAAYSGVTLPSIILFIGLFGWLYLARLVRSEFLVIREMEYVQAARAAGIGPWRIMWRHMLPNAIAVVIVTATFAIAGAMYTEAALDFLGFGLSPEIPTWGNMLTAGEDYITSAPLLSVIPGLVLTLAILTVNFIGDGLRDAFDPRSV